MKGPVVTFRPSSDIRKRLDRLARATGHTLTYHVERAIETHLPVLEERYKRELADLKKKEKPSSASGDTEHIVLEALEKDLTREHGARPKAKR